jgi:hypothetical protein
VPPPLRLTNFRHKHVWTPISLKSANLPDGRRAKAEIRLENRQALGLPFLKALFAIFALVWAEEGLEAVRKVAKKSPEAFVAIAARICPNDVRLTLGGMSLEDYLLMREVIAAIREGLPDADQMQPGQVFQQVLGALRDCSKNDWKTDSSICSGQIREWYHWPILQLNGEITRIPILTF